MWGCSAPEPGWETDLRKPGHHDHHEHKTLTRASTAHSPPHPPYYICIFFYIYRNKEDRRMGNGMGDGMGNRGGCDGLVQSLNRSPEIQLTCHWKIDALPLSHPATRSPAHSRYLHTPETHHGPGNAKYGHFQTTDHQPRTHLPTILVVAPLKIWLVVRGDFRFRNIARGFDPSACPEGTPSSTAWGSPWDMPLSCYGFANSVDKANRLAKLLIWRVVWCADCFGLSRGLTAGMALA